MAVPPVRFPLRPSSRRYPENIIRRKGVRPCLGCGTEFKQKRYWQKFCTPKCRRKKWGIQFEPEVAEAPKKKLRLRLEGYGAGRGGWRKFMRRGSG